jgi:hypothetical protein
VDGCVDGEHCLPGGVGEYLAAGQGAVPPGQVPRGGPDASGAQVRGVQLVGRRCRAVVVARGQARLAAGAAAERRGQSQRSEDLPGEERAVGLPGRALDDVP